jgi:uncharacterized repeat protein (TIGR02543 family)
MRGVVRHRLNHLSLIHRCGLALLLGIALLLALYPALSAQAPMLLCTGTARLHVKQGASGISGADWATALPTLQDALHLAITCSNPSITEIWVARGVYYPDEGAWQSNNDRSSTFRLKNNLAVYGGFAGGEASLDARDWSANPTILSGDIDKNDINSDGNHTAESAAHIQGKNAYHVVTGSSTDSRAILDGFTITAGQADGGYISPCGPACGGGMYNVSGSPTLTNVSFSGNSAKEGGGMSNRDKSKPTLTNVSFSGNSANNGGGMCNDDSSPTLTNVSFSGNSAKVGGGMCNDGSNPTLTNVSFSANSANDGGGMYNFSYSTPTLTNVSFSGNSARTNGGGMYNLEYNLPTLTSVSFSGNLAVEEGGGIYNRHVGNPKILNSIFWNNRDKSGLGTASASIRNVSDSTPTIQYSLVQGWNPGGTNLDGTKVANDPRFVTPVNPNNAPTTAGDLRLQIGSPVIDRGNSAANTTGADLAGNQRLVGAAIDLGAYETSIACPPGGSTRLYVRQGAAGNHNGASWQDALRTLQDALRLATPATCPGLTVTQIWVAQGVYYPDEGYLQLEGDRNATFQLRNGIAIYGGFAGIESTLSQRNWQSNVTILSGDIDKNDTNADGNYIAERAADIIGNNAYHVVTGSGTDETAILDGFTITAGKADGSFINPCGPACGGGMYNVSGSPTLANVTFSGNAANISGGGMYNYQSNPVLTNVSFSGNSASVHGGGMFKESSSPTLTNVSFSGNSAQFGGGMFNISSSSTLTNVSFSGNSASAFGGGIYNLNSTLKLINSIFWKNKDNTGLGTASASIGNVISTAVIQYSLVQGWNPGGNNLDGTNLGNDPLFVTPVNPDNAPTTAGDLGLQIGSPAIDRGEKAFNNSSVDLAGKLRVVGGAIDLGAYENQTTTVTLSANPAAGGAVVGGGLANHGETVTVTATANTGYTFVNWTEGSVERSTSASYSFTATGDHDLTANFSLNSYTIAVSASPVAGGAVAGGGLANHGETVTVTATANTGYTFVNWTEGGAEVSTSASYSFTATGDRNLTASFAAEAHRVHLPLVVR